MIKRKHTLHLNLDMLFYQEKGFSGILLKKMFERTMQFLNYNVL